MPEPGSGKPEIPLESTHENEHTVNTDGREFDVYKLIHESRSLPVAKISVSELIATAIDVDCWDDFNKQRIAPRVIVDALVKNDGVVDWEQTKRNHPEIADHISKIQNADVSHPILLSPDNIILDGMHRLMRAYIDEVALIPARKFKSLPESALFQRVKRGGKDNTNGPP